MTPYYIVLTIIYGAILIPLHLGLLAYALYRFILRAKECKRDFIMYVFSMIVVYLIVKLLYLSHEIVDMSFDRTIVTLRIISATIDNIATQIFIMFLDTVIISWAKINTTTGTESDEKTFKVITIVILAKYIFVFCVIVGYVIVAIGDWNAFLTFGWTLVFSVVINLSAITFWTLFVIMSRKTTLITENSKSMQVKVCHKKLKTTSIIVSVVMGLMCILIIGTHTAYSFSLFVPSNFEISMGFIDGTVIGQTIVVIPAILWLMLVTYSRDSVIVKYLIQEELKNPNVEEKDQSVDNQSNMIANNAE